MTNGDRIRSMSDRELAATQMLTCRECVYLPYVRKEDSWHCVKLGWDCTDGRERWLGMEERKL